MAYSRLFLDNSSPVFWRFSCNEIIANHTDETLPTVVEKGIPGDVQERSQMVTFMQNYHKG
jgi:hypothetical protein